MGEALRQCRANLCRLRFDGHLLLRRLCVHRVHRQHLPRRFQRAVRLGTERPDLHLVHHDSDHLHGPNPLAKVSRSILRLRQRLHPHHLRHRSVLHLQGAAGARQQAVGGRLDQVAGFLQVKSYKNLKF